MVCALEKLSKMCQIVHATQFKTMHLLEQVLQIFKKEGKLKKIKF